MQNSDNIFFIPSPDPGKLLNLKLFRTPGNAAQNIRCCLTRAKATAPPVCREKISSASIWQIL